MLTLSILYLDENQLTGTISEEVGNLINLNLLDLHMNFLTGTIPDSVGDLNGLGKLIQGMINLFKMSN